MNEFPSALCEDLDRCREAAERALERGEPLGAYDIASEGVRRWPDSARLHQLRGLSLSRSGACEAAAAEFQKLVAAGHADEETLGNLAHAYKALWLRDPHSPEGAEHLRQASQAYRHAFEQTGGYWTGVNAAVMALAEGDRAEAAELARRTLALCEHKLASGGEASAESYWLYATRGETALLLGAVDEASQWYRRAAGAAGRRYAHLASTRRQARLICELTDVDRARVDDCFVLPRIVAFTGHMFDAPARPTPRFPLAAAEFVKREIEARVSAWGLVQGYCSAACGADLLFLETLQERSQEAVVVLPFPRDEFATASVDFAGPAIRARFDAVLAKSGEPIVASNSGAVAGAAEYDFANRIFCGLAKIQGDLFDEPPLLLAAYDPDSPEEPGGAQQVVRRWKSHGGQVDVIDLRQAARRSTTESHSPVSVAAPNKPPAEVRTRERQQLVAILFADVQGYSKLTDQEILAFVKEFLTRVSRLRRRLGIDTIVANTWGDGIFAVFRTVAEAGRFALELADLLARTDWTRFGMPRDFGIRIALHAGPAFAVRDPLTRRPGFWGAHVSYAARMEPITPPGQVYASQAFAALARDEGDCDFTCQYVGRTPLAKGYGTFPTYHVARSRAGDRAAHDETERTALAPSPVVHRSFDS